RLGSTAATRAEGGASGTAGAAGAAAGVGAVGATGAGGGAQAGTEARAREATRRARGLTPLTISILERRDPEIPQGGGEARRGLIHAWSSPNRARSGWLAGEPSAK